MGNGEAIGPDHESAGGEQREEIAGHIAEGAKLVERFLAGAEFDEASAEALYLEYRQLDASIAANRERAVAFDRLARHANAQADQDQALLIELSRSTRHFDMSEKLRTERLRGKRLAEVALQVLAAHVQPGEAIHYKEWFNLLKQEGHLVGGQDPSATFLASISRSPQVVSVRPRSGLYLFVELPESDPESAES